MGTADIDTARLKELTRRALAGDAAAVRELRARGVLGARPAEGPLPASPAQQSLWLFEQQHPGSALYAMPAFLPLPPGAAPEAAAHAVTALAARHEALRTVFEAREGLPWLRVLPPAPVPLPVLGGADADPAARRRALDQELARPFDLERGPLARFFFVPEARP
ncbi:MAG: condensation domain-containing protein, partial [Desulfovibrionaceae bacterium]